jgi:hypothetical protein
MLWNAQAHVPHSHLVKSYERHASWPEYGFPAAQRDTFLGMFIRNCAIISLDSVFSLLLSDLDYEDKWEEAPCDIEEQMQAGDSITRNEKGEMVLRMASCITVANK